jgi:putative serine protease PepD
VVSVASGAAGALAVLLVLAAFGLIGSTRDGSRTAATKPIVREVDAASSLAQGVARTVVAVGIATPMGVRRISGVSLDAGRVLTSASALGDATEASVVTVDGVSHPASVLGRDDATDLALLRVDGVDLAPVRDVAPDVAAGEWVVAVGGGDGAGHWVTTGVVASVGGWVMTASESTTPRPGMISTDATLPPSSAGGALLDRDGRLVGVISGPGRDGGGGLATPAAMARSVAAQLDRWGAARHGQLWVRVTDEGPRGARVVDVLDDGPGDHAGLRAGDVVMRMDGVSVPDSATLVYRLRLHRVGDRVRLETDRDGRRRDVTVVLGDAPPADSPWPGAATPVALSVAG